MHRESTDSLIICSILVRHWVAIVSTCMRSAETVALKTAFTIQLGYRSPVGCLKVNRSSNTPRQATTQRARLFVPVIKVVTILKQYFTEEAMFHGLRYVGLKREV